MPRLVIDDLEVEVPEGSKVIDAAERLGIVIPRFCYHEAIGTGWRVPDVCGQICPGSLQGRSDELYDRCPGWDGGFDNRRRGGSIPEKSNRTA